MTLSLFCVDSGRAIAGALARLLGVAVVPPDVWLTFAVQCKIETANGSVVHQNNPLNLRPIRGGWPGQVATSPDDFALFGTLEAGCWACAVNYAAPTYFQIWPPFRANDPLALAQAIQDSPWDAGHYSGGLVAAVEAEMAITREQYAAEIEDLVKGTIRVMIEQDGETRNAIAAIAPAAAPAAPAPHHHQTGPAQPDAA